MKTKYPVFRFVYLAGRIFHRPASDSTHSKFWLFFFFFFLTFATLLGPGAVVFVYVLV